MKEGLRPGWKQLRRYVKSAFGYTVQAFKYESPTGETGWHTSSWGEHGPVRNCWVEGGIFYYVDVEVNEFRGGVDRVNVHDPRTDLDKAEEEVIMQAIKEWDSNSASVEQFPYKELWIEVELYGDDGAIHAHPYVVRVRRDGLSKRRFVLDTEHFATKAAAVEAAKVKGQRLIDEGFDPAQSE
jgi:hypothetical protein